MTRATIIYHGHCFDGMSSAVVFSRLLSKLADEPLELRYRGLDHQPGGSHIPEDVLDGEVNAVVDFRYTTSSKLTWWFDHHVTGLVGEHERAHFEGDDSGRKFFDPTYSSCCKLIADVARERFGEGLSEFSELIRWADMIDSARFADARTIVELEHPALQLMTVIEVHGNDAFMTPRIEQLFRGRSLIDVASDPEVQKLFAPLKEAQQQLRARIAELAHYERGVVTIDLVGSGSDRFNKFIPYWRYPDSRYSVAVSASKTRAKVSVGFNPWSPAPRTHDLARLCEHYGGGGHPVVGAISLPPDQVERARQIARELAALLRQDG